MSETMNELYHSKHVKVPRETHDLLFPTTRMKSVEERGREAVKRMFEAVDKARAEEPEAS